MRRQTGDAGADDQHRLLKFRERIWIVLAVVAERPGFNGGTACDTPRPPLHQARHEWVCKKIVETRMYRMTVAIHRPALSLD